MRKKAYPVDTGNISERLDSFVSLKSGLSRARIQELIKDGHLLVNSVRKKNNYRLKPGDSVELTIPDEPEETLIPEDIPLHVLWEDASLIVINKPPRMVVHPGAGHRSGTIINALLFRCGKLAKIGAPLRPGVVHRLDKDTSGVIVFAKNDASHHHLQMQFKKREIEKQYLALLYGDFKNDRGEIKKAVGRSVSDRKKMSTRTRKGREAVTYFEIIKRFKPAVLAKINIITGRTHQIRVHCAAIGHPVLGDRIYGKKTVLRFPDRTVRFSRQMLHAHRLKFRHPDDERPMECTAPMPEDMQKAIEELS
jgi:23S rRNA pseudouridine1911/1915/1917 synthase